MELSINKEASDTTLADFEGEVLRIIITDDCKTKTYNVHARLLRSKSPYFAALTEFKEGSEKQVILKDLNHDAFNQILHWLYRGSFPDHELCKHSATIMIETWIAADRLLMGKCKNMAMDALRELYYDGVICVEIDDLATLDETGFSTDSTLVKYLIHQFAFGYVVYTHYWEGKSYTDQRHGFYRLRPEMAWEIFTTVAKMGHDLFEDSGGPATKRDPADLEGCCYHDHVEDERCYLWQVGNVNSSLRSLT